jgi:hypothetical protein
MNVPARELNDLIVESNDLQADSRRSLRQTMPVLRDIGRSRAARPVDLDAVRHYEQQRRTILKRGGMGMSALAAKGLLGTGFGAAVTAILTRPASAQTNVDVQICQTASSLENLAVQTYEAALGLPFLDSNETVATFASTTMGQHAEHGESFNAAAKNLGGEEQNSTNPKYTPVVEQALPGLTDFLPVVELAATLEEVAQDTYLANLALIEDVDTRILMGSVMAVETQHLATLRAVKALLQGGAPELIAIPTDVAALPAAAGSVAFPEAFEEPQMASPPEEGAL